MPVIDSRIDVNGAPFAENRADMLARVAAFRAAEQRVRDNSERGRAKFESRGQLMPRDRLALLLDRGAPFVELSTLAGYERHDDDGKDNASGGGVITGIGFVSGLRCVVLVHDAAIKGGAITPGGLSKVLRAQDIALINKLPVVVLAESAGANLLYQSEIFVVGGKTFAKQARLSAAGVHPLVRVIRCLLKTAVPMTAGAEGAGPASIEHRPHRSPSSTCSGVTVSPKCSPMAVR